MLGLAALFFLGMSAPLLTVSAPASKTSGCSLSGLTLPKLPAPLAAPSTPASWVGLAIGTQNYTCSSAGTYTNVGAVAELFDISCFTKTPIFPSLADIAIAVWKAAPPAVTPQDIISTSNRFFEFALIGLGQHYYVPNPLTGVGINPKWDFTSEVGKANAFVVASKVNGASAPTGSQDIDWVQLGSLTGNLAKQVYRTDTRLGQPPASCTPGSPGIEVRYAAKYYGFGGSV